MSSREFTVIAILYPQPGKTDRVIELLTENAEYCRSNEPGTLKYEINRSLRAAKDGTEDIVMIERYKDQQSLKIHGTSEKFVASQKRMADEKLMRAPTLLKMVSEKGGFASRL